MTEPKKPMKIVFEEGCFDNLDLSQEELDQLVAEITQMANDGTLLENSVKLSDEDAQEFFDLLDQQAEHKQTRH